MGWVLALAGWVTAAILAWRIHRHRCLIESPTRAILLSTSGLPESIRSLRHGIAPTTYTRPRGKGRALTYLRVGTAIVYQTTDV